MKRSPTRFAAAKGSASVSIDENDKTLSLSDPRNPAQANRPDVHVDPVDIAHIGAIWKSPRDKRTCIQAGIKSYNGSAYLDLRVFQLDAQGRMRPTAKGITISPQRLMALAKLVGDAARTAHALGLTAVSS
jgi:hypothetical protein